MKKIVLLIVLLSSLVVARGEGIRFFEGTFQEALQRAKAEGKKVFVDFYTTWCGPCKLLSDRVFPNDEVGVCFNERFVNYRVNAEDKTFAAEVKRYGVEAYPTLLILDPDGNVIARQEGALEIDWLKRFALLALKEVLPLDQLYEKYRKDKKNLELVRAMLLDAPDFLARLSGQDYDKWEFRVERLYADYDKQKSLEQRVNREDFKVFTLYHPEAVKNDRVLNHVAAHYGDYVREVEPMEVSGYLFELSFMLTRELARKGDMDYLKELERVKGDLKPVYDSLMNFAGMDAYTGLKMLFEAEYYLYNKKDVDRYCRDMDTYFARLGEGVGYRDYLGAVDALYEALGEKLTIEVAKHGAVWLQNALKFPVKPDEQMRGLIMLGDCFKTTGEKEKAKKSYEQAYVVSLQFNNPALSASVQDYVKKLDEVK